MIDALQAALRVAGSGLSAQSARLRVTTENLANAQSTGLTPGADPYRRKTITFDSELDKVSGANLVTVKDIGLDDSPFITQSDPGNPAADADGIVKLPNVNMITEMSDMREAKPLLRSGPPGHQAVARPHLHDHRSPERLIMIAAIPLVTSVLGALAPTAPAATEASKAAAAHGDFGQVMSKVATDALNSVKGAEKAAVDGVEGKAELQSVVQTVMSAQESLQTALAVRDKAVAAFQEITRMAI